MKLKVEDFKAIYRENTTFDGYSWEKVDLDKCRNFVIDYFYTIIPTIGVIYLTSIYFGQKWMKNRPAYNLKNFLTIWNASLALFSIIYVSKALDDVIHHFNYYGLHKMLCHRLPIDRTAGFWGILYLLSKIVELGDTVLLILRKKPVIFLHWFHHFSILQTSFYVFPKLEPVPILSGLINAGVHFIMYSYYAIMTRVKVRREIAMAITIIQICQFMLGLGGTFYASIIQFGGGHCQLSNETFTYGSSLGTMYLILFTNMFIQNFKKHQKAKHQKEKEKIEQISEDKNVDDNDDRIRILDHKQKHQSSESRWSDMKNLGKNFGKRLVNRDI